MMRKLSVYATIAGLVCGYVVMVYALIRILVLINNSYLLSLAR